MAQVRDQVPRLAPSGPRLNSLRGTFAIRVGFSAAAAVLVLAGASLNVSGRSGQAALIAAFTLALILHGMRAESLHFGLMASFHIWLGFVATVQFTGALFAKQSMKLFAINTGYQLVCYLVMGTILVLWK